MLAWIQLALVLAVLAVIAGVNLFLFLRSGRGGSGTKQGHVFLATYRFETPGIHDRSLGTNLVAPGGARRGRRGGFSWIDLVIVLSILALIAAVSIPNIMASRKHGNEATAIGCMKALCTAEAKFRESDAEHDGNLDYGMLSELATTGLVEPELGSGTKRGYLFQATYSFQTSEFLWFGTADPVEPGVTADRYFDINQAGVFFYTTGASLKLDTGTCLLPNHGVIPC
jgi:competence protein ComGC